MRSETFVPLEDAQRFEENEALREEVEILQSNSGLLKESIYELELALEDEGWRRLGLQGEREFSRDGLDKIVALARIMFLKNPLIQRAVEIRSFYIWGQGVEVQSNNEEVNVLIHKFMDNLKNRREFTGHTAQVMKENKLQSEGNLFFVLFTSRLKGRVQIRSLPVQEVRDIILNPEDRNEVWYYVREWVEERIDLETGNQTSKTRKAFYPDWGYHPKRKPKRIGKIPIKWESPVYHVKVGGFDDMRFGVPETYAAIDWARAYKGFLEDWASLTKAISRFAWKVTSKRKNQISKVKGRLHTEEDSLTGVDTNPPPTAGSAWIEDDNVNLQPINKTGATTSSSDGKMLRLMVASAMHLPDTILSNDPQQGALATAKTLDRPTELAMTERQRMWVAILNDILSYVVLQNMQSNAPSVSGKVVDDDGEIILEVRTIDEEGKTVIEPLQIDITFPPVIEQDLKSRIDAIVMAITLDGKPAANVAPASLFRRLILSALGVTEIDEVIKEMEDIEFNSGGGEEAENIETGEEEPVSEEALSELVGELKKIREAL